MKTSIRGLLNDYYCKMHKAIIDIRSGSGIMGRGYKPERFWEERGKVYIKDKEAEGEEKTLLDKQREILIAELGELGGFTNILEVGCGYGRNLKAIWEKFQCGVVGVDFSASMLSSAGRYLWGTTISLVKADAADLPFEDESFDVVFTWGCMMHIPPVDIGKAISECARVTRKYIIHVEALPLSALYINWGYDYGRRYTVLGLKPVKEYRFPVQTWEKENLHFMLLSK